jgi:4-hydroxy-tetrahydrodipicolinate reductase
MNKNIRILINGAFGKMGKLATETLLKKPEFKVVGQLGRHDNLNEEILKFTPDVILDLTRSDCIWDNCNIYIKHRARFVIGTSGLTHEQIQTLQQSCQERQQGALIVPNFSIGAVLTMQFAKQASKWFDGVDIIEMHHHQKIDSPSGTAIFTANLIHEAKADWPMVHTTPQPGRETYVHQIPIHSVRMPGILARQDVTFGQMGETITLSHQTIDRQAYMPGVTLACEQVMGLQEMKIGLEHWLLGS